MKKYLYHLAIALFAISSFTLASCSDDDENPSTGNNGQYYCTINVDGEAFKGEYISGEIDDERAGVDYLTVWVNTNYFDDTWFTFSFCAEESIGCILRDGLDLCTNENWADGPNGRTYFFGTICTGADNETIFYEAGEGSIVILDYVESEYIELEFKNCHLYNFDSDESIIINGKLKSPLKGVDAIANL